MAKRGSACNRGAGASEALGAELAACRPSAKRGQLGGRQAAAHRGVRQPIAGKPSQCQAVRSLQCSAASRAQRADHYGKLGELQKLLASRGSAGARGLGLSYAPRRTLITTAPGTTKCNVYAGMDACARRAPSCHAPGRYAKPRCCHCNSAGTAAGLPPCHFDWRGGLGIGMLTLAAYD